MTASRRRGTSRPLPCSVARKPGFVGLVRIVQYESGSVQQPAGATSLQPRRRPCQAGATARRTERRQSDLSNPSAGHSRLPPVLPVHCRSKSRRSLGGSGRSGCQKARSGVGYERHAYHLLCITRNGYSKCLHRFGSSRTRLPRLDDHAADERLADKCQRFAPRGTGCRHERLAPTAYDFLASFFRCSDFRLADPNATNDGSFFCDPAIDRLMDVAEQEEATDPDEADATWAQVDREVTERLRGPASQRELGRLLSPAWGVTSMTRPSPVRCSTRCSYAISR